MNDRKRRREKQKEVLAVTPHRLETTENHADVDMVKPQTTDEESAIEARKPESSGTQKMGRFVKTKRKALNNSEVTKREAEQINGKQWKCKKPPRSNSMQKRAALLKITGRTDGPGEEGSRADAQTHAQQQKPLRPNSIMKMAALIKGKKKPPPEQNKTASNKIAVVRPMDIYAQVDKKKTDYELPELETDSSNQYTNLNKNINSSDKNEKAKNLKERKADETLTYENEDLYNIEGSNDEHSSNNTCQKDSGKINECKKEGNITNRNHTETFDGLDPNIYENVTSGTANSESKNELQQHDPNLYENVESKKDGENGEYEEDGAV